MTAEEAIVALVTADEAAGEPELFVLYYSGTGPVILGHSGWQDDDEPPSTLLVDTLEERGWVRVHEREGKGRQFAVSEAGRGAAAAHRRRLAAPAGAAVTLDWSAVLPILERFCETYQEQGAPEHGVPSEGVLQGLDGSVRATTRELVRAGLLEAVTDTDSSDVPVTVRPTLLTLQLLGRWPSTPAEGLLEGLVAEIDTAIEGTSDDVKRGKLVRLRELLVSVGSDVALKYFERKIGV